MFSPANILIVIIVGNDYSQGSSGCQAVVTDDRYMSSAWREVGRATCSQRHRLGSYVEEAGCQYNLFFDNCWNAASRMMNLCRRRPSSGGGWWSGRWNSVAIVSYTLRNVMCELSLSTVMHTVNGNHECAYINHLPELAQSHTQWPQQGDTVREW